LHRPLSGRRGPVSGGTVLFHAMNFSPGWTLHGSARAWLFCFRTVPVWGIAMMLPTSLILIALPDRFVARPARAALRVIS
jgi:hypothetical protein